MLALVTLGGYGFLTYEVVGWVIVITMVGVILRRQFAPGTSLAWLGIVFLHPYVGLILYLAIGETRLGFRRTARHRAMVMRYRTGGRSANGATKEPRPHYTLPAAYEPMVLQSEKISGMPVAAGNTVTFFQEAAALVDQLVADINAAQSEVHLLYYIFAGDELGQRVAAALEAAAARGVRCRVLVDAMASREFFYHHGLARELKKAHVAVAPALPVALLRRQLRRMDLRNHRKLAILDHRIAYVGSHNLINPDYGGRRGAPWVDLTGRFTGEIVDQVAVVFAEDWTFETEETVEMPHGETAPLDPAPPAKHASAEPHVEWASEGGMAAGGEEAVESSDGAAMQAVPTGPSAPSESFRRVFLGALQCARQRVILTTPYFVPDEPTVIALLMAADRGVDVSLVVPANPDHIFTAAAGRAHFAKLLEAGVSIFQYRPGLIHSKTTTVDDAFGILGSANLDLRSFNLNFEMGVVMYGRTVTQRLRKIQEGYIADSTKLTAEVWGKRSAVRRYADMAVSLLSPLL